MRGWPSMVRSFLIVALCISVALLAVCGTHTHVPGTAHAHPVGSSHATVHGSAYTVTVIDSDHLTDHDEDGDIDVDPLAKAFGSLSLNILFIAIALPLLWGMVVLFNRSGSSTR